MLDRNFKEIIFIFLIKKNATEIPEKEMVASSGWCMKSYFFILGMFPAQICRVVTNS